MKIIHAILFSTLLPLAANSGPFEKMDKNGDGKLTREELGPRAHMIPRIDKDGDGTISRQEDAAFHRQMQTRKRTPLFLVPPNGYKLIRDVNYADDDNPKHMLDLIVPDKKGDKPVPLLVFIHGGGWKGGSKNSGMSRIRPFLNGRIAGASVDYRLTDEAIWPAQIHDCKAAIRWLRANAEKYNLDSDRIAVFGTSAGGHLVAMLGVSGGVKDLEGTVGKNLKQKSTVTCVIDWFGPTEMLSMGKGSKIDHNAADSPEGRLVGGPVQEKKQVAISASPITHVTKDDAPILICHGDRDPLVPIQQSEVFDKKLKSAGVKCFFIRVTNGGHGFSAEGELQKRMNLFLEKFLLGAAVENPSEEAVKNKITIRASR